MPWRKLSPAPNKLDMDVNFTQFPFSFFPRLHQKESVRPAPIDATNHSPSVLIMATAFNSIATNSIVRLWTDVLLVPPREGALLISQVKGRTGKLLNNPMCGSAAKFIDSSDNRFLIRGSDPVRSGVLGQGVRIPGEPWWHRQIREDVRQKGLKILTFIGLISSCWLIIGLLLWEFGSRTLKASRELRLGYPSGNSHDCNNL